MLVGRDAELATIGAAVGRAAAGTPTIVLVEAEAGGGRSELLESLADSPLLPRRRIRSVRIGLEPGDDAIRAAAARLTAQAVFDRMGGRRRTLAALRKVAPDWISAIPGWGDLLEAITVTAAAIRRRRGKKPDRSEKLPEDIEALHGATRRRATAILLDDADHLDPAAADRVFRLVDAAETGTRLLVIATVRLQPPGAPPVPLVRACDRLATGRRVHVTLRNLDRAAVRAWLEVRLGGSLSESLLDDVIEVTGGLPRAIDTRISGLLERDALRRNEEGWSIVARTDTPAEVVPAVDVPDLGPLGTDVREALEAGAVLGDEFDALSVGRMLGREELWIEDRLAAAKRLGVLLLVDDAHEVAGEPTSLYRFTSAALRAALRRGVSTERRSQWESRLPA